jgi:hypothetical protein
MRGCLYVVRDHKLKLTLPGPSVTIQRDGTIWYQGIPLTGATDPAVREQIVAACKSKQYENIPSDCFTRLGDNLNGLWAGDSASWSTHPAKLAADRESKEREDVAHRTVTIYLSSRGWGDYSPCVWTGDITRPDTEILGEFRKALSRAVDVDTPNQNDIDLLRIIKEARAKWSAPKFERVEPHHGPGYCYACETYCYGDCGNYRPRG